MHVCLQITSGSYKFYSPFWDTVSDEAKDLISRLLVRAPQRSEGTLMWARVFWGRSGGAIYPVLTYRVPLLHDPFTWPPFGVSLGPRALLSRLQVLDPAERLTAREVMSHPWMRSASPAPLVGGVTDRLRKLTGKQRCVV